MKTILIPIDFSSSSTNAVNYVCGLSRQLPVSRIILLHSYAQTGPDIVYLSDFLDPVVEKHDQLKQHSVNRLQSLKDSICNTLSPDIEIVCISDERPFSDAIADMFGKGSVELIVTATGSHDESSGSHMLVEITTVNLSCPILVIPSTAVYQPIQTVLLASDLKDVSKTLPLVQVTKIVDIIATSLVVVNVDFHNKNFHADTIIELTELHKSLDVFNPEYYYPEDKDITHGILEAAEVKQAQIIVSIPNLRSGAKMFSISKQLAKSSKLPVLLMHN